MHWHYAVPLLNVVIIEYFSPENTGDEFVSLLET